MLHCAISLDARPTISLAIPKIQTEALRFFTAQEDEYLSLFKALPPNIKADILDIMRYTTKVWRL